MIFKNNYDSIKIDMGSNIRGLRVGRERPTEVTLNYDDFVTLLARGPDQSYHYLTDVAQALARPAWAQAQPKD